MKKKVVAKKVVAKQKSPKVNNSHSWPPPISTSRAFEPGYGTHSEPDDNDKTEWVLVETISTFRNRYMVEVPVGKKEWACDTVVMNEAKEFSQKYLDETIVSERVLSEAEALTVFDEDNDYLSSWDSKKKMETGFTSIADLKLTNTHNNEEQN